MKKHTVLALCASILLPASLAADTLTLAGTTIGAPTFNRPTETGARSFFTVPYQVYQFNVATTGQFTFTLTAINPASYDTFLHLFLNAFNPLDLSDPATNFLAGNDDRVLGSSELGSGLTNFTLNAGATYFLVVDGFFAADAGGFSATITGPGAINVIPEPSTTALLALAGAGFVWLVRRRRSTRRA